MRNVFRFAGDIAVYASHASQPVDPDPAAKGKLITDRVTLKLKDACGFRADTSCRRDYLESGRALSGIGTSPPS